MFKKLREKLYDSWCNCAGEILFFFGKQAGYSTGICGGVTCGYGELSFNGYWKYPVRSKERAMKLEFLAELEKVGAKHKQTIIEKGALD